MKNANPVSRWGTVALLAIGLAACGRDPARSAGGNATAAALPKSVLDFFPIKVGERTVRMQLAIRPAEMQRGLMERRDLGRDDGMIFLYDRPQRMSFWMRNTPTPLDIGFFRTDGTLAEVYALHPFDETSVSSRGDDLRFALEVNQGWYRANGVKPGASIDLAALAEAVRARGFDPARFGL